MKYERARGSDSSTVVLGRRTCIPDHNHPHDIRQELYEFARRGDPRGSRLLLEMERQNPMSQRLCRISCLVPHSRVLALKIGRCCHVWMIGY